MPRFFPFDALVYDVAVAGPLTALTAPPYDVISGERRRGCLEASPYNIVAVDVSEGSHDPAAENSRYRRAAELLDEWRRKGVIEAAPGPAYYAYEMRAERPQETERVRGIVCAMTLEPWGDGVLPHEETMPGPVEDRLRLLRSTRTHLSAVYGTVAGPVAGLAELLDEVGKESPPFEVHDEEGVMHRMWPVDDSLPVDRWLADAPVLIADGHHRYSTALAYRDERHELDGPGPWDRILTLIVDAGSERVPVLPYHRIQLRGDAPDGGMPSPDLPRLLAALDDEKLRYGTARRVGGAIEYRVHALEGEPPTVRALHNELLDRIAPGDELRFTHEAEEADRAVREDRAAAAYFLPRTSPERIRAVVERGERLPRKSTFFWPKPRTGMVMMPLDRVEHAI
jgi:uncharacterized protein (DUF1015 family)